RSTTPLAYPPLRAATSGHFVRQHRSTRLSWATPPNLLQKSYIFPTGSFHPTPVQGTLGLSLHSSLRLGRWLPPCHVTGRLPSLSEKAVTGSDRDPSPVRARCRPSGYFFFATCGVVNSSGFFCFGFAC